MDSFVDYYELLHVQPSAPEAVIKASYRAMMQKLNHHPDRGGEVGFAQLLNDAAKTLCDPHTRAQYDALRQQFRSISAKNHGNKPSKAEPWGEPGGSPTPENRDQRDESRKSDKRDDSDKYGKTGNTRDQPRADNRHATLPSAPQCPFCKSVYSAQRALSQAGYDASSRRCQTCNGARTPIAQLPHNSNEELRKMHRQRHTSEARLCLTWPCEKPATSALTDFSPAGCALVYSHAIDIGQVIMIETSLFNAICTVRHCKPTSDQRYFAGLEFVTLDMLAGPGALLKATA